MAKASTKDPEADREAEEEEREEGVGEGVVLVEWEVVMLVEEAGDTSLWEEPGEEPDGDDDGPVLARYDRRRLLRGLSLVSLAPGTISTLRMVTPDPPVALRLMDTLEPLLPPIRDDRLELTGGVAPGILARDSRLCSCWMVRGDDILNPGIMVEEWGRPCASEMP